ncbi:hypothetical protein PPERSA_05666 [Pseudocohnilembus persalinus]|uniref:Zinc finger, RanBP2-type n=1 Tax=Pseudocohnilembus persalinus TaxID=266149 RepID=A0A0V0QR16_PSEPJ|nr:hypothetical protein PPERSA_05666 [Pseudocohnilembus persalinus]|eukprot:KRX04405.1 hypothetical protein PPERSA_05666 [Pseudocohnilembus persalinus]
MFNTPSKRDHLQHHTMQNFPQQKQQFQNNNSNVENFRCALYNNNNQKLSNQFKIPSGLNRNRLFSGNSTETNTPENSEFDDHDVNQSYGFNPNNKFSHQNSENQQHAFQIEVKPKKKNFANLEEKRKFIQEYTKKQKTELCKNWETVGSCKFGDKCSFAHGLDQLKEKNHLHSNYKTKPCKKYFQNGFCSYGNRCQYLHHDLLYIPHYKEYAENIYQSKDLYLPKYENYGNFKYRWEKIRDHLNKKLKEKNLEPIQNYVKNRLPIFIELTKCLQAPEQQNTILEKNQSQDSLKINHTTDSLNSSLQIPFLLSNTSISQIDPQDLQQTQDDVLSISNYIQSSQNQQQQQQQQYQPQLTDKNYHNINKNAKQTSVSLNYLGNLDNQTPLLTNKTYNDINRLLQEKPQFTENYIQNSNYLTSQLPQQQQQKNEQFQQIQNQNQLPQFEAKTPFPLQELNFQNPNNNINNPFINYYQQQQGQLGDWDCLQCNSLNFASRDKCFKCGDWKPTNFGGDDNKNRREGDWDCFECGALNYGFRSECFKCNHFKGGKGNKGFNYKRAYSNNDDTFSRRSDSQRDHRQGPQKKKGDFFCSVCGELNFAHRDNCRKCGKRKDQDLEHMSVDFKPGDWNCPNCQQHNFANKKVCFKCQEPNPNKEDFDKWQDGDWKCFECGHLNRKHEDECFKCHRFKQEKRKGDTNCPECGKLNFAYRTECIECGLKLQKRERGFNNYDNGFDRRSDFRDRSRDQGYKNNNYRSQGGFKEGDWNCRNCNFHNFASRTQCKDCGERR